MGGMLHPTAKGIIRGEIAGLNNDIPITNYILKVGVEGIKLPNHYTLPATTFFIGFGTGYELGQKLRIILEKDTTSQMSLHEKVDCYSFLLEKQEICRGGFNKSFLLHIMHWDTSGIPIVIIKEVEELLNENKIQRALDRLVMYFKDNFYLKSLKEIYPLREELKEFRDKKRGDKKYDIIKDLEGLKPKIRAWIETKK